MASIGDAGISQKMMQDDVMTALLGLLDKVSLHSDVLAGVVWLKIEKLGSYFQFGG